MPKGRVSPDAPGPTKLSGRGRVGLAGCSAVSSVTDSTITPPITRASGKHRVVLARYARNKRLSDACYL